MSIDLIHLLITFPLYRILARVPRFIKLRSIQFYILIRLETYKCYMCHGEKIFLLKKLGVCHQKWETQLSPLIVTIHIEIFQIHPSRINLKCFPFSQSSRSKEINVSIIQFSDGTFCIYSDVANVNTRRRRHLTF